MSDDVLQITIDAQAALAATRDRDIDASHLEESPFPPGDFAREQTGTKAAVDAQDFRISVYSARDLAALELPRPADPVSPHTRAGMITELGGITGHGKTTFIAHEIRKAADDGHRVLVLDLEQHFASIQRVVHEAGLQDTELVDYAPIPEGLALERSLAQLDALERVLAAKPYELVVIDPFYKLHTADSNDEAAARRLVALLRGWIARHGFAILVATHCRKLPAGRNHVTIDDFFGSSVFVRDPELVLAIQRFESITKLTVLKSREPSFEHGQTFELLFSRDRGFYPKPTADAAGRAERLEKIGGAVREWIGEHPGQPKSKVIKGVGSLMKAGTDLVKESVEAQVRSGAIPEPVRSGRGALLFYPPDLARQLASAEPDADSGHVGIPGAAGHRDHDLSGALDLPVGERASGIGQVEADLVAEVERLAARQPDPCREPPRRATSPPRPGDSRPLDWLAMARARSRELGPALRPVAVPDDLGSSMPKASGRVVLPLHIRWSGSPLTYDLDDRADRARVYEQVLREGTQSDVRFYVEAEQLLDLWDELVLPPAVRDAWAERIARLRDESVLGPLQERVAEIVAGLHEAEGFALAGGAALIARGDVRRQTPGLDFVGLTGEAVDRLAPSVRRALSAEGLRVGHAQVNPGFVRFIVSDGDERTEVVLAADARLFPAEPGRIAPTLAGEELAVDKVLALFGRAEGRDFVDLMALEPRYGLDRLCKLAAEKDPDFEPVQRGELVVRFDRLRRDEFDLDDAEFERLRGEVARWLERTTC